MLFIEPRFPLIGRRGERRGTFRTAKGTDNRGWEHEKSDHFDLSSSDSLAPAMTAALVIVAAMALLMILVSAKLAVVSRKLDNAVNSIPASQGTFTGPAPTTTGVWQWTVNLQQCFTYSSPESLELIGYTPAQLLGQPVTLVMDAGELSRADKLLTETGGMRADMPNLVVSGRHRDGSSSWFEVVLQPTFDPDGEVAEFHGRSWMIGPQASSIVANQQTRARIEAIIANQLLMTAFQPIVDLQTGAAVGVEALTRFVSEPAVAPDVWFADAALVGLGADLELLAVATALDAAIALPTNLYVSFNVSPATCLDPRLIELIEDSGLDQARMVLELTEHSRVDDYGPLIAVLAGLRSRGIRVAVDDAGAGFASFRHIMQLRPDIIKLDRCIITGIAGDPVQQALASAVVSFANHLGARVLAEGVETAAELITIGRLGMAAGQGFLFGRPSVDPRTWLGRDDDIGTLRADGAVVSSTPVPAGGAALPAAVDHPGSAAPPIWAIRTP